MLITLGVGIAGLNTGNNLLYLLFGMMLSFIILSGILSDSSMRKLSLSRSLPEEVTANEAFPVKMTVRNRKGVIPSFALSVEDLGDHASTQSRFIVKVPPRKEADVFYHSKFLERGLKKYWGFKVLTKYPFGLIEKTDFFRSDKEVLVYPQIVDLEGFFSGSRFFHGEFLSGHRGMGVNPWGLRDYYWGDDARRIHWKSTAKSGKWMIKEFESEKKMKVVLDLALSRPTDSDIKAYKKKSAFRRIERAISMCASMILFLSKHNYETLLSINGDPVEGQGRGYITNYLKTLALLKTENLPTVASLRSPFDGQSMHIVMTNVSMREVPNGITNTAMLLDGERIEEVLTKKKVLREESLEL